MCTKKYLTSTGKRLHQVRAESRRVISRGWKNIIAFEYSSCYDRESVLRKFYTGTHTRFTLNDLKQSLRCNHRPTREFANWKAENNRYWFFETVKLDERNSPDYVRKNLSQYKTNSVDKNYKRNRKTDYPELFKTSYHINQFISARSKWASKKYKALRYKIKRLALSTQK